MRAACLGEGGIIETGNENTVVLDMSSIDLTESKAIAAVAEALTFAKKAGTGLPGHPGRLGWFHRYGRQGSDDVSRQLQARI